MQKIFFFVCLFPFLTHAFIVKEKKEKKNLQIVVGICETLAGAPSKEICVVQREEKNKKWGAWEIKGKQKNVAKTYQEALETCCKGKNLK